MKKDITKFIIKGVQQFLFCLVYTIYKSEFYWEGLKVILLFKILYYFIVTIILSVFFRFFLLMLKKNINYIFIYYIQLLLS